jgi:hypothetical protein
MRLKECTIYKYAPDNYDLFEEDEEGSIWSMNFFFFNKALKRVCYLHLRGISILTQPSTQRPRTPVKPAKRLADDESDGWLSPDLGARKRARYWLGDREGVEVAAHDEEHHEREASGGNVESQTAPVKRPLVDEHDNYVLSDDDVRSARSLSKSTVRGISEEIADSLEV